MLHSPAVQTQNFAESTQVKITDTYSVEVRTSHATLVLLHPNFVKTEKSH